MTEDEAKTKWCPFARVFPTGDYWQSTNGAELLAMLADDMRPLTRCIASACMAWRLHGGVGPTGVPNVASKDGYCGLAGKP